MIASGYQIIDFEGIKIDMKSNETVVLKVPDAYVDMLYQDKPVLIQNLRTEVSGGYKIYDGFAYRHFEGGYHHQKIADIDIYSTGKNSITIKRVGQA